MRIEQLEALMALSMPAGWSARLGFDSKFNGMSQRGNHRSESKYTPHQGKQECARRVRQMAKLKA